jgi:hypothetical protein
MTGAWLAVVVGALLGSLCVWGVSLAGFAIPGWVTALIVTAFAVAIGVAGTGFPTGHDRVTPGPA